MQRDGGVGRDTLVGGAEWDVLYGHGGADVLRGNGGEDVLFGGAGDDSLYGGTDDDYLDGGAGADLIDGGAGTDAVGYEAATGAVTVNLSITTAQNTGAGGLDRLVSIENLAGSAFGDRLTGDAGANGLAGHGGNDTLIGGAGDDWLEGGAGDDSIDGGAGIDTLSFANAVFDTPGTEGIRFNNPFPAPASTGEGVDVVTGVENIVGSSRDDVIYGDNQDNWLAGLDGNDVLNGGYGGHDYLEGGAGDDVLRSSSFLGAPSSADTLDGGAGADQFWLAADSHVILGGDGVDTLHLETRYDANLTIDLAVQGPQQIAANYEMTISSVENLYGGDGADTIYASTDRNVIDGGGGMDRLVYRSVAEMGLGAGADRVRVEFVDVTMIDADITKPGKQSFILLGEGQAFTGRAGEAMYTGWGGDGDYHPGLPDFVMSFDINGDGIADGQVTGAAGDLNNGYFIF